MPQKVVELRNICKSFPGVVANDHINFDILEGEIHALLGENGAGKTTLMKILYGLYLADAGEIYIKGQPARIKSPLDAIKLGVGMVHQIFMQIPALTVTENILLGLKFPRGVVDKVKAKKEILDLALEYGLEIDPDREVQYLSVGEAQRVEILKMLYRGVDILILDEPTSVLTPIETKGLFEKLKLMAKKGKSIVFITHKLDEALAISDRLTVLRDGRKIGTVNSREADKKSLAKMMIGRDWYQPTRRPTEKGGVVLETKELSALNDLGLLAVNKVSITIREGEILGIAGVSGNGQRELAECIVKLRKPISGKIFIDKHDVTEKSVKEITKMVAYIPEEKDDGLVLDLTVAENMILKTYTDYTGHLRFLNYDKINQFTENIISEFGVKASSVEALTRTLSGGNLQKLILARELSANPRLVVACQPTKGLDVGATASIQEMLLEKRSQGMAILLVSEDLDEILSLSDRIAVMYRGEIVGVFDAEKVDVEQIGLLMTGEK
ncbi:MAG: ABC transporter ATP-binding protein [Candidatus Baldrarchaeia archaeon]